VECSLQCGATAEVHARRGSRGAAAQVSSGAGAAFSVAELASNDEVAARGCLGHGEDLSNQLLPKKIEAWAPGQ